MEVIAGDVQRVHLGVADLDALLVCAGIERAFDLQSGFRGRRADQLDDGEVIGEWPAAPVLSDVAEHAVLYLVPLRRSRRIVENVQGKPGLVGEFLKLPLPQSHTRAIGAAAVRSDRQFVRPGVTFAPHAVEPAADRLHGELSRIARDADTDKSGIVRHVVNAIGRRLAQLLVDEVMYVDAARRAFRTPVRSAVPEVADP